MNDVEALALIVGFIWLLAVGGWVITTGPGRRFIDWFGRWF